MEYYGNKYFRPPDDYEIGIKGGPILPKDIYNSDSVYDPLMNQADRYCLLYSPVAPSGQKIVLVILLSGLFNNISVISINNGQLNISGGMNSLSWSSITWYEESLFDIARSIRLPALIDLYNHEVISNDPYLLPIKLIYDLNSISNVEFSDLFDINVFNEQIEFDRRIFYDFHAAVYRAGFILSQDEYNNEVEKVYQFLTDLNQKLHNKIYLFGDSITISDIWLFTLLIRYDQVYAPGFRLHKYRLSDFSEIWRYIVNLYSIKEFSFTTDFSLISKGYFLGIPALNRGIVPKGPDDFFLLSGSTKK